MRVVMVALAVLQTVSVAMAVLVGVVEHLQQTQEQGALELLDKEITAVLLLALVAELEAVAVALEPTEQMAAVALEQFRLLQVLM
jgi:hypothetical protein